MEKPGSTPPNMTRILSEITPSLAKTFNQICSMNVFIIPLLETNDIDKTCVQQSLFVPYTTNDKILRELGISFERIHELESLGVLRFNSTTGYALLDFNRLLAPWSHRWENKPNISFKFSV